MTDTYDTVPDVEGDDSDANPPYQALITGYGENGETMDVTYIDDDGDRTTATINTITGDIRVGT